MRRGGSALCMLYLVYAIFFLSEPSVCIAKSLAAISRGSSGQTLKRQAQSLLAAPAEVIGLALRMGSVFKNCKKLTNSNLYVVSDDSGKRRKWWPC